MRSTGENREDFKAALSVLRAPQIGYGKLLKSVASQLDPSERVLAVALGQTDSQYFNKDMAAMVLTTARVLIAAKPMAPMTKTRSESIFLGHISAVEVPVDHSPPFLVYVAIMAPGGPAVLDEVVAPDAVSFAQALRDALATPQT